MARRLGRGRETGRPRRARELRDLEHFVTPQAALHQREQRHRVRDLVVGEEAAAGDQVQGRRIPEEA